MEGVSQLLLIPCVNAKGWERPPYQLHSSPSCVCLFFCLCVRLFLSCTLCLLRSCRSFGRSSRFLLSASAASQSSCGQRRCQSQCHYFFHSFILLLHVMFSQKKYKYFTFFVNYVSPLLLPPLYYENFILSILFKKSFFFFIFVGLF